MLIKGAAGVLANHPGFFNIESRREKQTAGDQMAFVDAAAFPALRARLEAAVERRLAAEHQEP